MKLILPYFIIILALLQHYLKKSSKNDKKSNDNFWKRESDSNMVRKKEISQLDYIQIPDDLPYIDTSDSGLEKAFSTIQSLKDQRILNLTGLSNTDLKLQYGTANLTILAEYDNHFSDLVRAIATAGSLLMKSGHESEALAFLEYGISINTDIKSNYIDLANYYFSHGDSARIKDLIQRAEKLHSLMKDSIVSKLKEIEQQ